MQKEDYQIKFIGDFGTEERFTIRRQLAHFLNEVNQNTSKWENFLGEGFTSTGLTENQMDKKTFLHLTQKEDLQFHFLDLRLEKRTRRFFLSGEMEVSHKTLPIFSGNFKMFFLPYTKDTGLVLSSLECYPRFRAVIRNPVDPRPQI